MNIVRVVNGISHTFTLSQDELYAAYWEQETAFDQQDVKEYLDELDPDDYDPAFVAMWDSPQFVATAADILRDRLDDNVGERTHLKMELVMDIMLRDWRLAHGY